MEDLTPAQWKLLISLIDGPKRKFRTPTARVLYRAGLIHWDRPQEPRACCSACGQFTERERYFNQIELSQSGLYLIQRCA